MTKAFLARFESMVLLLAEKDRSIEDLREERSTLASERKLYSERLDASHAEGQRTSELLYSVRQDLDWQKRETNDLRARLAKAEAQIPKAESNLHATIADGIVAEYDIPPINPNSDWQVPVWETKIANIRRYREATGTGLKEAKDAIEAAAVRKLMNAASKEQAPQTLGDLIRSKLGPRAAPVPSMSGLSTSNDPGCDDPNCECRTG